MNRKEFISQLESLLSGISQAERDEALQYYNDYFNDAGVENEWEVIKALGTPARVAESIKADLSGKESQYEFTEKGIGRESDAAYQPVPVRMLHEEQKNSEAESERSSATAEKPAKPDRSRLILLVIILVATCPIWGGLAIGLLGGFIGIIGALIGFFVAFAVGGVVLLVLGVIFFCIAIFNVITAPMAAITMMGAALFMFGFGMIFMLVMYWLCKTAIPYLVRAMIQLCRLSFAWMKKGANI